MTSPIDLSRVTADGLITSKSLSTSLVRVQHWLRPLAIGAMCAVSIFANAEERSLNVLATAYNSTPAQTDSRPNTGAWGDRIEPGMKIIAVSPDLVKQGLKRGTKVSIDGVDGEWTVLDRTPSRYKNRIDIYMGVDIAAARKWGRRKVTVRWQVQ